MSTQHGDSRETLSPSAIYFLKYYKEVESNRREWNRRLGYLFKTTLTQSPGQSPKGSVGQSPRQTVFHRRQAQLPFLTLTRGGR